MQRFNSWNQNLIGSYWRTRFKPKDLIRTLAHINSVLSMQQDVRLLERYDINEITDSRVGSTYVWLPIQLDTCSEINLENEFPYVYDIDPGWLYIDAIYDNYTDPQYCYQNNIDYKYKEGSGKLQFVHKIPEDILSSLYISKGQYAGYRLYKEIGCLYNYPRQDSTIYRDSFGPILAAFYLGPTYANLLAVLNEVIGYPVVKYGNEKVLSIEDGIITTDKYTYDVSMVHNLTVKTGDILYQYQPFSDDIKLVTHKTDPYWWKKKAVELFSKYRVDGIMTEEIRDYLMETFLFDVVLSVNFNINIKTLSNIKDNADILALFFSALPTRTDILLSQQSFIESLDETGEILDPNMDVITLGVGIKSIFGYKTECPSDETPLLSTKEIGRPIILDPGSKNKTTNPELDIRRGKWHVFDEQGAYNKTEYWESKHKCSEFFKHTKYEYPMFEPYYDNIYINLSKSVDWSRYNVKGGIKIAIEDIDSNTSNTGASGKDYARILNPGFISAYSDLADVGQVRGTDYVQIKTDTSDLDSGSIIPETGSFSFVDTEFSSIEKNLSTIEGRSVGQFVPAEYYCGVYSFDGWDLYDAVLTRDGISVYSDKEGYFISQPFYVGLIPKRVNILTSIYVPPKIECPFYYSFDRINWKPIAINSEVSVPDVTNNIYFKAIIRASTRHATIFKNLRLRFTVDEK